MPVIETSNTFEKAKEDGIMSPQEAKKILETPQWRETIQTPPISDEFARRCCKTFEGENDFHTMPNYHLKLFLPILEKIKDFLKLSPEIKKNIVDIHYQIEKKIFYTEIYPKLLPIANAFKAYWSDDFFWLYKEIKWNGFEDILVNSHYYSFWYLDEVKKFIIDRPSHPLSQALTLKSQENKDFIKSQLDGLSNKKNTSTIENTKNMLNNTNFMDINYLAVALQFDAWKHSVTILSSLLSQVDRLSKKSGWDPVYANFNGARFGQKNMYVLGKTTFKQHQINNRFMDGHLNKVEDYFKKNKNQDAPITIRIPQEENSNLKDMIQDIACKAYWRTKFKDKITIIQDPDQKNISIQSKEKKEIPPKKIRVRFPNFYDNMIAKPEEVQKMIVSNPEIKKVYDDPDAQILWIKSFGCASKNPTSYTKEKSLEPYLWKSNRIIETEVSKTNSPATDPQESSLTNNPLLASDRAASLYHNFPMKDKVSPNATIDLSYGVRWPTREELKNMLWWTPTEEELKKKFEERQYAELELEYTTQESVEKVIDIPVDVGPIVSPVAFNIFVYDGTPSKSKYKKTKSNNADWWWQSSKKLYWWTADPCRVRG